MVYRRKSRSRKAYRKRYKRFKYGYSYKGRRRVQGSGGGRWSFKPETTEQFKNEFRKATVANSILASGVKVLGALGVLPVAHWMARHRVL